jgi:hypothetical protein
MESFEKLLPILFLIIWTIIAVSAKKRKKQQRPAPNAEKKSKRQGPLLGKLQSSLDSFFTQLAQGYNEELPASLKASPETGGSRKIREIEETIEGAETEITLPERRIKPPKPVKPGRISIQPSLRLLSAQSSDSISRLRAAVIWSEILGKPVGMRDY